MPRTLPDGLDVLREQLSVGEVMKLIEATAKWVDPETFHLLPVWYPEHARKSLLYKSNWSNPQTNTNRQSGITAHKQEGNVKANEALTRALGLRKSNRQNWSCCHIWGVDDQSYQYSNTVVQDARYFSCVANMVLLPTPLKAFTDAMNEVKQMLRVCVFHTYGWICEHEDVSEAAEMVRTWTDWSNYPLSWPKAPGDPPPEGIMSINDDVRASAAKRIGDIRRDIEQAGANYPRDRVQDVLKHWQIDI